MDKNRWCPYFIVGLFCTDSSVPCLDTKNSAFAWSEWFHRHEFSHNRLNLYSRQSKCFHFPSCDKTSILCLVTIIEVVISRRVCNTDRHMDCILMDANFEIRYSFCALSPLEKDCMMTTDFILALYFFLQTSRRPCLKPQSGPSNSKWFVDTTFISISLSNHISCGATK